MHLRRALLLFAIVLGLAALAASFSRPRDDEPTTTAETSSPGPPTADARPAPTSGAPLAFQASDPRTRRASAGTAVQIVVSVPADGEVAIPALGLTSAATPAAPARFDVLAADEGRYDIRFTPANGDESRTAGKLVVTAAR